MVLDFGAALNASKKAYLEMWFKLNRTSVRRIILNADTEHARTVTHRSGTWRNCLNAAAADVIPFCELSAFCNADVRTENIAHKLGYASIGAFENRSAL